MLAGWAVRRDAVATQGGEGGPGSEGGGGGGYLGAALGGYCLGCFLCEVTNSGGGQPGA